MLKKVLLGLLVVGAIAAYFLYGKYQDVAAPNVPENLKNTEVLIPTNSTFNEVVNILMKNEQVMDTASFKLVAELMSYKKPTMRPGRYRIEPGWSNRDLIRHLRGGQQEPVKLVINGARLLEDVAQKVAEFIEADSADLANIFYDESHIAQFGFTTETLMSLFIPNTYEMYWNSTATDFFKRMVKEHNAFWQKNNRLEKAKAKDMNAPEVYTLASIVERETNQKDEKKRMAGVYINRLKQGMPLQADPTVIFATRDFSARRVLNRHTAVESPYNTYKYAGLPPGPISMASISSIDAVLQAEDHEYLYFCARPDNSGYHAFAKTLTGHNKNADKYRRWLNQRKIRK